MTNKESFDALLQWLDPDRDNAGRRYEVIRAGLIRMFISNGLSDAEYYADEAIERVTRRLPEIRDTYVGDPTRYFHGVGRNVIREGLRRKEVPIDVVPDRVTPETRTSDSSECLTRCLRLLPRDKQEFILDYHLYKGHEKVEHHRQMAGELSITEGALRTRAHHLRVSLEKCVLECMDKYNRNKSDVRSHS